MSDGVDDVETMIEEYRQLCEREGEILDRLQSLRMEKAVMIASINHGIGKIGQHDRDVAQKGEEHVDGPEFAFVAPDGALDR
jgi:hypothetical protein